MNSSWSPTKSIQKTWKALSARETLAEGEEKPQTKRSLSNSSKTELAGPSASRANAKLPPVSPRNSTGRNSGHRESVSNRFASAFGRKYNVAAAENSQSGVAPTPPQFQRQKSFDFSLLLKRKSGVKSPVASASTEQPTSGDTRNLLIRQKTDMGNYSAYKVPEERENVSVISSSVKTRVESTV